MDSEASDRTRRLVGDAALARLAAARVLVVGLGGVGSWCAEALARAGIGTLGLLDCDVFSPSNLNRQLGALRSTLGRRKTDVMRERVLDIAPDARVETFDLRYGPDTADQVDLARWAGVRVYSAMGGGNKFDPQRLRCSDLSKTNRCPLAKTMRKKLRKLGIEHLAVVASDEEPRWPFNADPDDRIQVSGTLPTVVGAAGLLLAHVVLRDLIGEPAAPLACQARDARLRASRGEG